MKIDPVDLNSVPQIGITFMEPWTPAGPRAQE